MADSLWVRKDSHGRTWLGLIPIGFIALGLGSLVFYASYRYLSTEKEEIVVKNDALVSEVSNPVEALASFDPTPKNTETPDELISTRRGEDVNAINEQDFRPRQNVLEMSGLNLGDFSTSEAMETRPVLEEDLSDFADMFKQGGLRSGSSVQIQRADDGFDYLRSKNGIYTAFAEPGTELTGPNNGDYIVGEDLYLYKITATGKQEKETKIISGNFMDEFDRFYRISKNNQLRLMTPGPVGSFTGPDDVDYNILPDGTLEEINPTGDTRPVQTISGEGEFVGSDEKMYAVFNGILFKPTDDKISFGADIMSGSGIFSDSTGITRILGEDGKIYKRNADGSLDLANLGGPGTFIGPDGSMYNVDELGNVSKISKGNKPVEIQDDNNNLVNTRTSSLRGSSNANQNLIAMGLTDGDELTNAGDSLKGATVYVKTEVEEKVKLDEISARDVYGRLMPIGQKIPFALMSTVSTQFAEGGMVEAVISENIYFRGAKIPAGSRMYGSMGTIGKKGRLALNFNKILLTSGEQIEIEGAVYDTNMNYGIEAYYEAPPAFVTASRYANAYLQVKVVESLPTDEDGEAVGDTDAIEDAIAKTQEDLETRYGGYHIIPQGTVGVFMLTNSIDITEKNTGISDVDSYNNELKKRSVKEKMKIFE